MNIEYDVFKGSHVDFDSLINYGFRLKKNNYILEKDINNDFLVVVSINKNGEIAGKIFDKEMNEEYLPYKNVNNDGSFVNSIRNEYKNILNDIKNNCFISEAFVYPQSNRIVKYAYDKYKSEPEFLWEDNDAGIFRNKKSNKWYGIIMRVDKSKITNGTGEIEVLNIKLDEDMIVSLLKEHGYYKAYHMNKKKWISIILDDSIHDEEIFSLIDTSYILVGKGKK